MTMEIQLSGHSENVINSLHSRCLLQKLYVYIMFILWAYLTVDSLDFPSMSQSNLIYRVFIHCI